MHFVRNWPEAAVRSATSNVCFWGMNGLVADKPLGRTLTRRRHRPVHFAGLGHQLAGACHFFIIIIIIVIRHKTTAAARWALLLIVSTLFNDAITVAVWTGFHVCLPMTPSTSLMSGIWSKADITLTSWKVAY
jgi:hypothetical protein